MSEKDDSLVVRTYKYRMYPSSTQERRLYLWAKWCRQLYNLAIEQRRLAYRQQRKNLSWQTQSKELPMLKDAYSKYRDIPAGVFEFMLKQVDQAYKKYFDNLKLYKRGGLRKFPQSPGFKSFRDDISLTYLRSNGFRVTSKEGSYARIFGFPKLEGIRVKYHKEIDGEVLGQKIIHKNNKWYLCITLKKPKTIMKNTKKVGVDLGVVRSVQLSTGAGDFMDLPKKRIQFLLEKKRYLQRNLKRKIGGNRNKKERQSNNYRKAYAKIAKIDEKVANIRKYYLNMFASDLASDFGIICVENLKVKNMTKSAKGDMENPGSNVKQKSGLNRSVLNLSPYFFKTALKNKAEEFGSIVVEVDPRYTSQKCSACGHTHKDNRKTQDEFVCVKCGLSVNADYNASLNILAAGTSDV